MLFSLFLETKDFLSATLHLSRDALHIHVGLIIFVAGGLLLRGHRWRFGISFLGLLALCLAGEAADALTAWDKAGGPNWLGGAKDVVNTMFWPTVSLLAWPHLLRIVRQAHATPLVQAVPAETSDRVA